MSLKSYAEHYLPIFRWLPSYRWREDIWSDLSAALTVTAVAAPEAVAYATIAGLPAQQGLYTGLLAPLAYALTGASPQLIVGPTAIMCILTHNAIPTEWAGVPVHAFNASGDNTVRVQLAAALALAVALVQMLIALLRLGGLVSLISLPVVAGFTTGSALLTASSQFTSLLGMGRCSSPSGGSAGCTFGDAVVDVIGRRGAIKWDVAGLSFACVALLAFIKFHAAVLKALRVPLPSSPLFKKGSALLASLSPLILVLVTVPIEWTLAPTLDKDGLPARVPIPSGLPPFRFPFGDALDGATAGDWMNLLVAALPLAIIGYMGAVTIAKTVARQSGGYPVFSSQEAWAQVAGNFACALGAGLPITGSFSRTAVNATAGARSAFASLATGILMGLALLTLTVPLSHIPTVARSAIVIVAIGKMIELHLFAAFWRADKRDVIVFTTTLLIVIFVDSATGLAAGVIAQWGLSLLRAGAEPMPIHYFVISKGGGEDLVDSTSDLPVTYAGADDDDDDGSGESGGLNSGAISGAAASAVLISVTPDLQFANAQRVTDACAEALALLKPRVMILDLGGASGPTHLGGAGVALDTTGAAALHAIADSAAVAGVFTLAYGLSAANVAHVISAATPAAGGGRGDDFVKREGGRAAGNVLLAPSFSAARSAASAICVSWSSSRTVVNVASVNDGDSGEIEKEESLLHGGRDEATPLSTVRAVPPSPFSAAAIRVRRKQGILSPSQRHRELLVAGEAEQRGLVDGLRHEISSAASELWHYLSSDPPLLVAATDKI